MEYTVVQVVDGYDEKRDELIDVEVEITMTVVDGSFDHAFGTEKRTEVDDIEVRLYYVLNGKNHTANYYTDETPGLVIEECFIESAIESATLEAIQTFNYPDEGY